MSQKYFELTKEEQELLDSFEKGEWKSVPNQKAVIKRLIQAAKATLAKTKNINLRLSQRTLLKLKSKAAEEAIPYQTLAASILHKYVSHSL
ncbi:MAG: hypothetical protein UX92_C0032G0005 [Candidatus Amesbacteria bacterium GW2011_GWA1_47_20]|uniref:Antitoxin n=1 Tax=Candidatus Amesbacteria bacterium GW2011_GWA1_47_20 TaxID=1618354 RepID=A0A0G1UMM6_9BACT|nr:MAG: hypothetical protein UX92_C0032G0005 [Candidatus Amesbacteria bacterium GW2011_GWA1_47_20]